LNEGILYVFIYIYVIYLHNKRYISVKTG
jgi:hypothetical protein